MSIPEIITIASKFCASKHNTTIYEEVFINLVGITCFLIGNMNVQSQSYLPCNLQNRKESELSFIVRTKEKTTLKKLKKRLKE